MVSHYHLHLLKFLRHPGKYWLESLLVTGTIIIAMGLLFWLWGRVDTATPATLAMPHPEESTVGQESLKPAFFRQQTFIINN